MSEEGERKTYQCLELSLLLSSFFVTWIWHTVLNTAATNHNHSNEKSHAIGLPRSHIFQNWRIMTSLLFPFVDLGLTAFHKDYKWLWKPGYLVQSLFTQATSAASLDNVCAHDSLLQLVLLLSELFHLCPLSKLVAVLHHWVPDPVPFISFSKRVICLHRDVFVVVERLFRFFEGTENHLSAGSDCIWVIGVGDWEIISRE